MGYEIYYTSAPEGLKRGSSGFCTVAASDNIPKALWDRLESLSAYRHQIGVAESGGAGGANPVSYAHWILNVAGKTYHVLSRVCDSGVDHTHRSNAFAHHLVVEAEEIAAASAGPAWLLDQPGVMASAWDGRVGALSRGRLPGGDGNPGGICRAWERATGDAGWGGHLIDVFVKSPSRAVCILFSPGQDAMPLLAEAIALLPPATRWNITFNTYFTGMPTSATCLWRCCLAGTPAAQNGKQYAANGILIDLTDPHRMGLAPDGPYTKMARTGQAVPTQRPAAPAPIPAARPQRAASQPVPARPPVQVPPDELENFFDAEDEASLYGLSPATPNAPSPQPGVHDDSPASPLPAPAPVSRAASGRHSASRRAAPMRSLRTVDEELQWAQGEEDRASARRRKQVMILFGCGLGAIVVASILIFLLSHTLNSNPAPEPVAPAPPKPTPQTTIATAKPAAPPISFTMPQITPISTSVPATVPQTQSEPVPPPVTPVRPLPPVITYPDAILLSTLMDRPQLGAGISDRVQTLAMRSADIDSPQRIRLLQLRFPLIPTAGAASDESTYKSDAVGTLTQTPVQNGGKPAVSIKWKGVNETGQPSEAALITFDRSHASVDVQWRSSLLMNKPEMIPVVYWVMQKSSLELIGPARDKAQRIAFKAYDPGTLSIEEPSQKIAWPVEPPVDITIVPPAAGSLPEGWEASWYPDWEEKNPALRSPENASQVIKFRKVGKVAEAEPWFLITFRPGFTTVESNFAKHAADAQVELGKHESELSLVEGQIAQARLFGGGKLDMQTQGAKDALAKKDEESKMVDAYKSAIAAYNQLTQFDLLFNLSDGLNLAKLRFARSGRPGEAGK